MPRPALTKVLFGLGVAAFASYWLALVVLGAAGLFVPGPELAALYRIEHPWAPEAAPTLLHQYRFLKAFVLGFALFAWIFRREILSVSVYNRIFLAVLFGAAGARLLSIAVDGRPHSRMVAFAVSELIFGVLILLAARTRPKPETRPSGASQGA